MTILEPVTMLTDYVLALAGIAFAWRLRPAQDPSRLLSILLWRVGFLATGAAAAVGGTYHGFALYFSQATHGVLWQVTVFLIAASAGIVTWAVLSGPHGRGGANLPWLIGGGVLTGAGFALQQSGVSIHTHFNHNDLYHCIQTVALFLLFKGASLPH